MLAPNSGSSAIICNTSWIYSFSSLDIPTILPALPDFLAAVFLAGTRPFALDLIDLTAGASCIDFSSYAPCAAAIAAACLACSAALCSGVVEKSYTGRSDLFGVVVMVVLINDGLRVGMRR